MEYLITDKIVEDMYRLLEMGFNIDYVKEWLRQQGKTPDGAPTKQIKKEKLK